MKKIKTALISVSDKKDLKPLLNILKKNKIKIISSGGTYKEIKKLKFKCFEVSDFTGSSEILGGRVKTLHPKIHAGILNKRNNKSHLKDLKNNNFENIDLVIVNFYPFEKILKTTKNHNKIVENIDVGGPTMVRSAAKNYKDVTVITSSDQYEEFINELKKNNGSTTLNFREKMSQIAFTETAYYDSIISNYFNKISNNLFPRKKIIHGNLIETLRYGENPHQKSAIYSKNLDLNINQVHGKQLSYNNYNDIYSALSILNSFKRNEGTVIIKHANPCGASLEKNKIVSFKNSLACDPVSAFGGVVGINSIVSKALALELNKIFFEIIIAKGYEKEALKILKKKRNIRLINSNNFSLKNKKNYLFLGNSFLAQDENNFFLNKNFKVVTKKKPTRKQISSLKFAFNICKFVKSNAIVLSNAKSTIGIGSGQPSRLDSSKIACGKALKFLPNKIINSVAASDAFFPFADGIEELIKLGVGAIIQPGGSVNDREVIKAANEAEVIMVFTGTRHFKH